MVAGRPHLAGAHIAQIDVGAPSVAGRIFAPTGHSNVAPTAVTGPSRGYHDRITPIRKKLRTWNARMRVIVLPLNFRCETVGLRPLRRLIRWLTRKRHVARHPLLKQQLS